MNSNAHITLMKVYRMLNNNAKKEKIIRVITNYREQRIIRIKEFLNDEK